ncbi:MAG: type II secretion system minor pseudopilin GspI [Gammaproteobacteria bacterium]|jgi:general secretion pathway protein I|nr:type II secretion system minor pseudopilin GspI [Gammaproteobacteria bacterium]
MRSNAPRHSAAFSLLEVMIALAIISIAVLALSHSGGNAPSHYKHLRDSSQALWVAENVITQLRIDATFPSTGTQNGTQFMGQQDWRWQAVISATADRDIRRADIVVFSDSLEQPAATHIGFFGRN